MHGRLHINHAIAVLAVALGVGPFGVLAARGASSGHGSDPHPPRVRHARCFTLDDWNAPDGRRPCVKVTRVYEDGSFTVKVLDANGTVRYTRGVGVPSSYGPGGRWPRNGK